MIRFGKKHIFPDIGNSAAVLSVVPTRNLSLRSPDLVAESFPTEVEKTRPSSTLYPTTGALSTRRCTKAMTFWCSPPLAGRFTPLTGTLVPYHASGYSPKARSLRLHYSWSAKGVHDLSRRRDPPRSAMLRLNRAQTDSKRRLIYSAAEHLLIYRC